MHDERQPIMLGQAPLCALHCERLVSSLSFFPSEIGYLTAEPVRAVVFTITLTASWVVRVQLNLT